MTAAAACMVPSWLATVGPGRPWSSRRRAHRARRGAGAPRSARRSPREHLSPRGSRETPRSIPSAAGPTAATNPPTSSASTGINSAYRSVPATAMPATPAARMGAMVESAPTDSSRLRPASAKTSHPTTKASRRTPAGTPTNPAVAICSGIAMATSVRSASTSGPNQDPWQCRSEVGGQRLERHGHAGRGQGHVVDHSAFRAITVRCRSAAPRGRLPSRTVRRLHPMAAIGRRTARSVQLRADRRPCSPPARRRAAL